MSTEQNEPPIVFTDKRGRRDVGHVGGPAHGGGVRKGDAPPPPDVEHASLSQEDADRLMAKQVEEEIEREDESEPEGMPGVTAFYVVIDHLGGAVAVSDCNTMLNLDREATVDDMHHGCSTVLRDIQAATTAKHVVFGMQVSAAAMQEKRQAVQSLDALRAGHRR